MFVLHQNSWGIVKFIPSALDISLDPGYFSPVSGNLSGHREWISQYLPRFGEARIYNLQNKWKAHFLRMFKMIWQRSEQVNNQKRSHPPHALSLLEQGSFPKIYHFGNLDLAK